MKFRGLVVASFLVGFVWVGVSCKARKVRVQAHEAAVREPYDPDELEAYFPEDVEGQGVWKSEVAPSGESTAKVDNICTRRRIGDHMCPELFLLGMQKGGTTSLWMFLVTSQDLEIQRPLNTYKQGAMPKEVHFFDKQDHYAEGPESYAEHFAVRDLESQVSLDATPGYSRYARVPSLMVATINVERSRFLVAVRDPVHRSYSWYTHILQRLIARERFNASYQVFDYKFSLMAKYLPRLINECVDEFVQRPELVFEGCWHLSPYMRKTKGVLINETGLPTIYPFIVNSIFADSLYGYMMLHLFRYLSPDKFCIIIYENLVASFADELQHIAPCLKAFGREISERDVARGLPMQNHIKCATCRNFELLEEEELKAVGRDLNEDLFTRSNDVFRDIMREHFNRTGVANWEEAYNR
ncbi:hypothetical protein NDN08_007121 [Rhodosorus marinus]|uniref:Sulfotransferase domain-containing protein n=1 Tax=Rhodosorus marinus TaxID=101924 RepID=A0AAV8UJ26_9RHOD|nr:hypothetical protein NDN08_007121 [Rhodosorus marinus]